MLGPALARPVLFRRQWKKSGNCRDREGKIGWVEVREGEGGREGQGERGRGGRGGAYEGRARDKERARERERESTGQHPAENVSFFIHAPYIHHPTTLKITTLPSAGARERTQFRDFDCQGLHQVLIPHFRIRNDLEVEDESERGPN